MPWYRCLVSGEDFPLVRRKDLGLYGFYATRFVEAATPQEAEDLAARLVSADPDLAAPMGAPGADRARLYVEEVVEVEGPGEPGSGFTFYLMKDA